MPLGTVKLLSVFFNAPQPWIAEYYKYITIKILLHITYVNIINFYYINQVQAMIKKLEYALILDREICILGLFYPVLRRLPYVLGVGG